MSKNDSFDNFKRILENGSQLPEWVNKRWKPQQFENVWFLVDDPTKNAGVIPAYGNIKQIMKDGTMDVRVISAETRLGDRIPYEGHAVMTADECASKKNDVYKWIRQANAEDRALVPVTVDGYNLEAERYRYLRPHETENSEFKVRQVYLAEDTPVYIRNYLKTDNREGFWDNFKAGGKFYMAEEPYNGVALISTTEDGKDGYCLPINMNYIRQEVRLDPEQGFNTLPADLQMYIQDGGKLYMLGEPLGSDIEPIAYLSKESCGGTVCTTVCMSDIEYVTVEDQRMKVMEQDQSFESAVAGIPVDNNQLEQ